MLSVLADCRSPPPGAIPGGVFFDLLSTHVRASGAHGILVAMALPPIEFHDGATRMRHYPLAALPAAREIGRLVKRANQGAIDRLSYLLPNAASTPGDAAPNLDRAWLAAIPLAEIAGLISDLLAFDEADEVVADYLRIGNVEIWVGTADAGAWVSLAENPDATGGDPIPLLVATREVLGGIVAPFVRRLQPSSELVQAPTDGTSTASTDADASTPTAPTLGTLS